MDEPGLREHGLSFDRGISPSLSPNVPYTEYAFVEFLSLPSQDVAYLSSNDCLTLPGSNALDGFVQGYFKRIHPLVPVLDEAEFWRIYQNNHLRDPKYLFSCCNHYLSSAVREFTSSLARNMNQVQRQSCLASVRSSSVGGRGILNDINIEVEPEKNLTPQTVRFNCNSSSDAFCEYPTTPSFMLDEQLQYNRLAKQTYYDNTAPNLDFVDFVDFRSVPSNEMETYALGIPLKLIDQILESETPLEHPGFDTCAGTLPQSLKVVDSLLFDTFFHETFVKKIGPLDKADFC
ncbi:unnamed protein product [Penicillium nalgiovense]|uniref:Uncharacterized protein n=1 Tax=Penicillium nalgiovense TaxID=60175 RepID=A0A9W4HYM9_PENNA|nr:unnamed protein product [Penicillium nalgiovense]CAG7958064.1 unnamed protein product [Penicillium nalgiovense]CAG7974933.1 unnamed protein product [Penicillium nalgiovense]CAG7982594.1 unnamed protein product [Penicillium nalgiovense]CAG7983598.1 unnamed protein product [Penicillium nalgiovense]